MIDIGIACTLGCEQALYFCLITMLTQADHPEQLDIWIGIDTHTVSDPMPRLMMIRELSPRIQIELIKTGYPHSSLSHGMVLDVLLHQFTHSIGMVCDADIAFIHRGWDTLFLSKFTDQIRTVGITSPHLHHVKKQPSATCIMFDVDIAKSTRLSFIPEGTTQPVPPHILPATPEQSLVYGVPIDHPLVIDTGSELCRKFGANYQFPVTTQTQAKLSWYEYHLPNTDQLILCHLGASTKNLIKFSDRSRTSFTITYKPSKEILIWMKLMCDRIGGLHQHIDRLINIT